MYSPISKKDLIKYFINIFFPFTKKLPIYFCAQKFQLWNRMKNVNLSMCLSVFETTKSLIMSFGFVTSVNLK